MQLDNQYVHCLLVECILFLHFRIFYFFILCIIVCIPRFIVQHRLCIFCFTKAIFRFLYTYRCYSTVRCCCRFNKLCMHLLTFFCNLFLSLFGIFFFFRMSTFSSNHSDICSMTYQLCFFTLYSMLIGKSF